MKYSITVTKEALEELEHLKNQDRASYIAILTLLEQFEEDEALLGDLMISEVDYGDPTFEKKPFRTAQKAGYNIQILKFHTLDGHLSSYRVLIGFDSQNGNYYVLSIPHRQRDYESDRAWLAQLYHRYEQCGMRVFKR